MADTTTVKIPKELIERCDERARLWAERYPGVKFTRSDAVRVYLTRGLDAPDELDVRALKPAGKGSKLRRKANGRRA